MAFFKFRKGPDDAASAPVQPPNVESIRQRAKYRLVGAAVLVLIGVVGLPLLFDKEPRPIAVNTPIDIPDKSKVPPLVVPPTPEPVVATAVQSASPAAVVSKPVAAKAAAAESVIITETAEPPAKTTASLDKKQPPAHAASAQEAAKNVASVVPKPVKTAASAVPHKAADAGRAQALLDGGNPEPKPTATKASEAPSANAPPAAEQERFVVQVGAFAEAARAQEVRLKVERAGMKTYTHVAETKDGSRIRVRVGPFTNRAEADKTAEKIKKLGLPAALLTL